MRPLKSSEIRGNWATLLLPVSGDDSIDHGALSAELDAIVAARVDGVYSNGTAGEFHNQTGAEFERISQMLAERCERAGLPFQIGASHPCPVTALERAQVAAALKPSAIQVILPDWFPPSMDEARAFLEKMAEAVAPVGLVLYNPPHAKRLLTLDEIAALKAAVPTLVGLKLPGGDEAWYAKARELLDDLSLFIPGHHLATGLRNGAHGAYSNVACLAPAAAQRWSDAARADEEAAMELEGRIQRFMGEHIAPLISEEGFSNGACDKLLASIGGWAPIGTRLRWPYKGIPEQRVPAFRDAAKRLIPEFF